MKGTKRLCPSPMAKNYPCLSRRLYDNHKTIAGVMNLSQAHLIIVTLFLFLSLDTLAHPGRTDAQGGHYDRKTGEYHFHNGGAARQAPTLPAQTRTRSSSVDSPPAIVEPSIPTPVSPTTAPLPSRSISEWRLQRLKQRAEADDADSQFELGERLINGDGVEKDTQKGREWLSKAARAGHAWANKMLLNLPASNQPTDQASAGLRPQPNPAKEQAKATPNAPAVTEDSVKLLARAEELIRGNQMSDAAEILNRILRDASNSKEAGIVKGLVRLLKQEGSTPYTGSVTSCTVNEVSQVKEQLESMEDIAKNYQTTSREKREALDAIFGYGTFSNPVLNLEGLFNATRRMEASRQKAIRGQ